jgi:predicted Zn-dependent peptidase
MTCTRFVWLGLVLLGLCGCAPSMRPPPTIRVGSHHFERRELANGLRAVAVKDTGPDVSVFVIVGAGKRNETVDTTGLAHLVEHAMYTGTREIAAGEHDQRIVEMGGESNAFTREDNTFFYDHKIPRERLEEVLGMEAQRLRGLQLPEEAVLLERERRRVEEQATWQPAEVRRQLLEAAAYRVHPYSVGVLDPSGHTAAPDLAVSEIRTFYDRHYHPNETVVVVAGAVEANVALDAIEVAFGSLLRGPKPPAIPEEPEVSGARDVEIPSQLSRDRLEWVWLVPAMGHPERPALNLLARLLSRRTSQEGVPFTASMGERVDKELFRIAATGESAEQEISSLMRGLQEDFFSMAEVEAAKNLERDRFEGLPLRARPYFSLAVLVGAYEVAGYAEGLSSYADRIDVLSASDLSRILGRRLAPENRISVRFLGTGTEEVALPDDLTELAREAMNAEEGGDFERALEAYTKLLSLEPSKMNRVIYLSSRGQVRMQQLDYAGAIADFDWALSLVDYPAVRELRDEARALLAGGVKRHPRRSNGGAARAGAGDGAQRGVGTDP